jgi:uncharacterized protein
MIHRLASLALVLVAAVPAAGRAQTPALPTLTQPVNDLAHVIDEASAQELDRRIRALQAASGDAVIVATVDTYAPYGSIEEYAVQLYEHAGIGQRGKDNGVLILLAVHERRVRIEVGYGLEQFITDGFAGDTIRQAMLPEFRAGRYGAGLLAGATRVIQRIASRRGVTLSNVPAPPQPSDAPAPGIPIIAIIILLIVIARVTSRWGGPPGLGGRRRWPGTWSGWYGGVGGFGGGFGGFRGGGGFGGFGGGGGGGFGGFGGGISGGGGASGGW